MKLTAKKKLAMVAVAFRKLPKRLRCPHCGKLRAKKYFGMRVMGQNAAGELVIRRQSHCGACR